MPEYTVDVPVWHGPGSDGAGNVGAEELTGLGVSDALVERLRAWQQTWEQAPSGPVERRLWLRSPGTMRLARQLQAELPDHRVFVGTDADLRPVDEWAD